MRYVLFSTACAVLLLAVASRSYGMNLVECLAQHSKAECKRQMLIEYGQSKPLTPEKDVWADSGKFSLTISGENWLKHGFGGVKEKMKDLGLIKDDGTGVLNIEKSDVAQVDFENVITEDMKALYEGLKKGFKDGKIDISATTQMELIPLKVAGANATLGRFCYHMNITDGKTVCVYEGFIGRAEGGETYKLLGSAGDYDGHRQELESIIMSFKFTQGDAPAAQQ